MLKTERAVVRVRSDAPRLSDIQSLSVTIFNDQSTRSDDKSSKSSRSPSPDHQHRSSSEQRKKTSKRRRLSADRDKRKRSSSEVEQRQGRSVKKSKPWPENSSKTRDNLPENGKKSSSRGVVEGSDSEEDSSSVVAVEKRVSRGKTVRMYRTVKLQKGCSDDSDVDDDNDDGKSLQPTAGDRRGSSKVNGVSEKKTSSSRERRRKLRHGSSAAERRTTSSSVRSRDHRTSSR